jgi:ribonuclease BN (tRNA processing enzyme)
MDTKFDHSLDKIWHYSYQLKYNLTLKGHSRGGERSGFYVPELGLMLDAGIRANFKPKVICVTHCHRDHSFALPVVMSSSGYIKQSVYVPKESEKLFKNMLLSSYQLSKGSDLMVGKCDVTGVLPENVIKLTNDFFVKVYDLDHDVPTRGYGICMNKKKLNAKYRGLDGKSLHKLKKDGICVSEIVECKILAYLCDTTTNCFSTKELLEYEYVVCECTFFTKVEMNSKHIHWDQLLPFVVGNPKITFILIHFSGRYGDGDINLFFVEEFKKNDIKNVKLWLN